MEKQQEIAMAGMGYVGLFDTALLAWDNPIRAVDIQSEKVDKVNRRRSPIADPQLESRLDEEGLILSATTDIRATYGDADFVIIATSTDYDAEQNHFDAPSVEAVAKAALRIRPDACIIIRSAVPLGFAKKISSRYLSRCILLSPEFLREGKALYDNLYLSRIILELNTEDPVQMEKAHMSAGLLKGAALKEDIPVRYMSATKAEAVKLFSSTYLTMRVTFFDKLDTYAEVYGLSARNIIEGVCLDPRIGTHYNNPPFGYGGYCLPKNTRQLLANHGGIPSRIMTTIMQADQTRKSFIAGQMLGRSPKVAGIYRLTMKADSDNFHHSPILGIVRQLERKGVKMVIYGPALKARAFLDMGIISDLEELKRRPDVILANRYDRQLESVRDKVHTRNLFLCD